MRAAAVKNFVKQVSNSTQKAKSHKKLKWLEGIIHLIILNKTDLNIMSNLYFFYDLKWQEASLPSFMNASIIFCGSIK